MIKYAKIKKWSVWMRLNTSATCETWSRPWLGLLRLGVQTRKDRSPADACAILCPHFWVPALAGHAGHAGHAGWLAKCGIAWACHPSLVASQPSQALGHPRSWALHAAVSFVACKLHVQIPSTENQQNLYSGLSRQCTQVWNGLVYA